MSGDRLSLVDTTFLALERPTTPMNIGVVIVLDGGPLRDERGRVRLDALREAVRSQAHAAPRLRQRPRRIPLGLGRPVWVDVDRFDVADHIDAVTLPEPTREALHALASAWFMVPLDRRRPLWADRLVDGLPDGQIALLLKVHHAVLDGTSGLDVLSGMFSVSPEVAEPVAARPWSPAPPPTATRLMADALSHQVRQLAASGRHLRRVVREPRRAVARAARFRAAVGTVTGVTAGRLPFNAPAGVHRRVATAALPLDDLNAARSVVGGTVNDVLVATVAGAIRRLLEARGEPVAGKTLTLLCPVNVRTAADRPFGNEFTTLPVEVDLTGSDPVVRLRQVRDVTARAKADQRAVDLERLVELADVVVPASAQVLAWTLHERSPFNCSVSNLASVPVPVWLLGARLRELYPIVPLTRRLGIAVTAFSHAGTMFVGINADADLVPDVDLLADGIGAELADLVARPAS